MSPLIPLTIAAVTCLLIYGRHKRLSARPQRSGWGDPRPRALAESLISGMTVLVVGKILAIAMAPAPAYTALVFTGLALVIAVTQFLKAMRAPRALITIRR